MDNTNQEVNKETIQDPQYTEVELKAIDQGWVPKDKFEGGEDDFIDAKEFLRRGELFAKIDTQKRELSSVNKELHAVKKALGALKEHYGKVEKASYEKALKDLKEVEKQALIDGDVEKFYAIKEQIQATEEQAEQAEKIQEALDIPEQQTPVLAPEFIAWKEKNAWYESVPHMRLFADQVGLELAQKGVSKQEILKLVEQKVREEFPHKFRNPNKDKPGLTESGDRGSRGAAKDDFQLSDQEKRIMNTLVSQGVLTKEKYIADLKLAKGIK